MQFCMTWPMILKQLIKMIFGLHQSLLLATQTGVPKKYILKIKNTDFTVVLI